MRRILIDVDEFLALAHGTDSEAEMTRELRKLADSLDDALPYRVELVHSGGFDYLAFTQKEEEEDRRWLAQQAEDAAELDADIAILRPGGFVKCADE